MFFLIIIELIAIILGGALAMVCDDKSARTLFVCIAVLNAMFLGGHATELSIVHKLTANVERTNRPEVVITIGDEKYHIVLQSKEQKQFILVEP